MSVPAEWREWARKAVETDARVHGFGLRLARRIAELDRDCGACFAAVRTLARAIGSCERTVQRWLRKLERWGYVLRLAREWRSGMTRSAVLVPVAPIASAGEVSTRDIHTRVAQMRRAEEHTSWLASTWRPSHGLRTPSDPTIQKPVVSRGDTVETVTGRSWFEADEEGDAAAIFAGWGSATGPGPGDPGWQHEAARAT